MQQRYEINCKSDMSLEHVFNHNSVTAFHLKKNDNRGFKIFYLKGPLSLDMKPVSNRFLFSPLTNERIVDMNVVALICALQST